MNIRTLVRRRHDRRDVGANAICRKSFEVDLVFNDVLRIIFDVCFEGRERERQSTEPRIACRWQGRECSQNSNSVNPFTAVPEYHSHHRTDQSYRPHYQLGHFGRVVKAADSN